jgi:hypothetical protein
MGEKWRERFFTLVFTELNRLITWKHNIFFTFVKIIILLMPTKDYLCLGLKHSHEGNLLLSFCSKICRDRSPNGDEVYKWKTFCWTSFIVIDVFNYRLTNVCAHIDKNQNSELSRTTYYFI